MTDKRRKGVAIVDTEKGILVVSSGRNKKFTLPGGGAERWETRKKAAIRELEEETGLKTKEIKYLFSYLGTKWHMHNGRRVRNLAKVFLVKTEGIARPRHEIKYVDFWKTGSDLKLGGGTKKVIEKYVNLLKK